MNKAAVNCVSLSVCVCVCFHYFPGQVARSGIAHAEDD